MIVARRPKAKELRTAGDTRGDLEAPVQPKVDAATVPVPHFIEVDPFAEQMFRGLLEITNGFYAPTDYMFLASYCRCASLIVELNDDIDERGIVLYDRRGNESLNPSIAELRRQNDQLKGFSDRLALNPEARVRLGLLDERLQSAKKSSSSVKDILLDVVSEVVDDAAF